ncbi:MAG: M48 family metallopeptidase [Candidatus Marsarchaeota archaeon]|jgi:heat shock protein HtpX|nr:M48 family metallopeptidase [Candidatus Marsarchaeota archaeon]
MASFFDEIARNKMKSILLLFLFSLLFVGIIFLFTYFLGLGIFGLIIAVVIVAAYALFVYFSGEKFVLKVSGAKPADKNSNPYLYDTVEGLAAASQLPMPKIYIINDPNPNAFATGRNKNHSYVVVTSGLLSMMNKTELQGVLAHEMSHIYNNDILFMLIAVIFVGAIGIIAAIARTSLFFGGFGGGGRNNSGIILIIALVLGLLAPLFAMLIRLAISRRREYMADANGARIIRNPQALANALKKIEQYSKNPQAQPAKNVNAITAPLYFSNPIKKSSLMNLFSTHPPIEERIKRLEKMY